MSASFAGILSGSWINCILFSIEAFAAITYSAKHHPEGIKKWLLIVMLSNDLIQSVVVCVATYLNLLVWHSTPTLYDWISPVIIAQTFICCMIEQLFLLHRFYTLSKNWWYTFVILLIFIVHTAFSCVSMIWVIIHPEHVYNFGVTADAVAAISSSVADILIAVGIVYTARSMHTTSGSTKSILRHIIHQAILSGSITCIFTCLKTASHFFQTNPLSPILTGCVGRVYSLTVVFALLLLKEKVSDSDFETDSLSYSTGASRPAKLTTIRFHDGGSINTDITDYREDLHLHSHGSSLLLDSRSQAHTSDNMDIRKSEALSEKRPVVEKQEDTEAWERKRSHNTV